VAASQSSYSSDSSENAGLESRKSAKIRLASENSASRNNLSESNDENCEEASDLGNNLYNNNRKFGVKSQIR
jgi:hypothetical protein